MELNEIYKCEEYGNVVEVVDVFCNIHDLWKA